MQMTDDLPTDLDGPATDDAAPRRRPPRRTARGVRHELLAFFAVSTIALLVVAAATIVLSGWIARSNQLDDAERAATRIANNLVAPRLEGVSDGQPVPEEPLDAALGGRLDDG